MIAGFIAILWLIVSVLFALALIGGLAYFLYWLVTSWTDESLGGRDERDRQPPIDDENDQP